jgi:hypothetical protein
MEIKEGGMNKGRKRRGKEEWKGRDKTYIRNEGERAISPQQKILHTGL